MTTGLDSVERTLAGPSFDEWLANHAHREMEAAMQRKQRKQREGELKQRRQVESAQLFEQWLSRKSYFEKAVEVRCGAAMSVAALTRWAGAVLAAHRQGPMLGL